MSQNPQVTSESATDTADAADLVAQTLVEEVSIDGMCGVY